MIGSRGLGTAGVPGVVAGAAFGVPASGAEGGRSSVRGSWFVRVLLMSWAPTNVPPKTNMTAKKIIADSGVPAATRVKDLTEDQTNHLRDLVEKTHRVEGELKREIMSNIKRLKDIGAYRGVRHIRSLPVRGQRTRSNSRTIRGNVRRTMGSGKRKLEKT